MNHWVTSFIPFFDWRFFTIVGVVIVAALFLPAKFLKPFRSIRFNVWLFLIIAVFSAIGTFIPQNKPAEEALRKLGPFWTNLFDKIGFLNLYHAWWFGALLGLMAFDVIVCKLRKLPVRIFFLSQKRESNVEEAFHNLNKRATLKEAFGSDQSVDAVRQAVTHWFGQHRMKVRATELTDGWVLYAGRQRFQRWGDFVLHVSIVIVLLGNLMGAIFGFEEPVPVMEGGSAVMKHRPYEVFLHDFDIEYYQSTGAPSLYASDLEVREQGKTIGKKRIIVNDPLDIHRVRFYQASWGMTDQFRSATIHIAGTDLTVKPDEVVAVPKTPLSIRARQFLPSFDVDANQQASTVDYEGRNPALLLDFLKDNAVQASVWVLKNQPELAFRVREGRVFATDAPPFRLINVDAVLFSGIQVGYDPGAPVFWFGALMLVFGLGLHFYSHQRRVAIVISPKGNHSTQLTMGGWNSRRPDDFRVEFETWAQSLKQTI